MSHTGYEMLVLDLDGTLTNSQKEIPPATKQALMEIMEAGKIVVLASGRPTHGIVPLAKELELEKYGGYILSFNGAQIIDCRTENLIYNKVLSKDIIKPVMEIAQKYDIDILTYHDNQIWSGIKVNEFTQKEAAINHMEIVSIDGFAEKIDFPVNKLLLPGEPARAELACEEAKKQFHGLINVYRSEPFFVEIMPQNIDKAYSLQKLLNAVGLTANEMICCGDGYNDVSMIEFAGLGVAMGNSQTVVLEKADFITKSNDEDGILHVINSFMR